MKRALVTVALLTGLGLAGCGRSPLIGTWTGTFGQRGIGSVVVTVRITGVRHDDLQGQTTWVSTQFGVPSTTQMAMVGTVHGDHVTIDFPGTFAGDKLTGTLSGNTITAAITDTVTAGSTPITLHRQGAGA